MTVFGYARVSTQDQDLAAQVEALAKAGAETIHQEKVSGAKRDRIELRNLIGSLQRGDVLMVTRLDRLARSTLDLLTILETVAERGAQFKSLADSWADTTTPHGRLMLTILGGLAEFERSLIIARTGEGRKRAMAAGVKFGPPFKLKQEAYAGVMAALKAGKSVKSLAKDHGVDRRTIQRIKKKAA